MASFFLSSSHLELLCPLHFLGDIFTKALQAAVVSFVSHF